MVSIQYVFMDLIPPSISSTRRFGERTTARATQYQVHEDMFDTTVIALQKRVSFKH
jgi:hypothetical protein